MSLIQKPSFFVVGGMKSGTTTLHYYLKQHPRIFMREDFVEHLHFFSIDDVQQNPEFFYQNKGKWDVWDFEKNYSNYNKWYLNHFKNARKDQIAGEVSVSYLHSLKTPKRILEYNSEAKIIIILRHPVKRLVSQYYHQLRENRITMSLDNAIQFAPGTLINRSSYLESINRYYNVFSSKNILVLIFEEFIKDIPNQINLIYDFLGLEKIEEIEKGVHLNKAQVPRSEILQLTFNKYVRKKYSGRRYKCCVLPGSRQSSCKGCELPYMLQIIQDLNMKLGPQPKISLNTQRYLNNLLELENRGLSKLLNKDFSKIWDMKI